MASSVGERIFNCLAIEGLFDTAIFAMSLQVIFWSVLTTQN